MEWLWFILGLVIYQFLKVLLVSANRAIIEYRQKRVLNLVDIEFPDHSKVSFISVDTSDKRAMAKLERQLREQYDIPEDLE